MKAKANMRPFWGSVIVIAVLAGLISPFGPWWIFILVALIGGYIAHPAGMKRFSLGFVSIFVLWLLLALVLDLGNGQRLSAMVGSIFGGLPSLALVLVTALLGGLLGGLATMSGSFFKDLLRQRS